MPAQQINCAQVSDLADLIILPSLTSLPAVIGHNLRTGSSPMHQGATPVPFFYNVTQVT